MGSVDGQNPRSSVDAAEQSEPDRFGIRLYPVPETHLVIENPVLADTTQFASA